MDNIAKEIKKLSQEYFEEVRNIRRHLHMHPELSGEEMHTADFICMKLDQYRIPYKKGVAGTGVVGLIEGENAGSGNIALRADMDALPICENNEVEYKSTVKGKMHACGHDVHMACLLGAARILTQVKDHFQGSVKLIFQPSEETFPGGAVKMIREGVLKDPETLSVIGQHVINTLDAGKIGLKAGAYMASADEIYLAVKGTGGHAATPEQLIDPVFIASSIVVALQQIVSRNANPLTPTVLSFGRIIGEGRTNIIPDEVRVEGTIRTFDEKWRKTLHTKITHMATTLAEAMGGRCDVKIAQGYPSLYNDESLTHDIRAWATEYLGENNVIDLEARMTAEDFSYFAREVPATFYRLGIRNRGKRIDSNLHTPTFDVDESCLVTGTGLLAFLAVKQLSR